MIARLLDWYCRNRRELPWRRTPDPYRVWVSEIMLQQTRVEAVIPYYERFLALFPTIEALAAADEPKLLTAWAGLGYYRRARLLQEAAREVVEKHQGALPADHAAIRSLPGVGDYTAAAVASIAFGLPHAVLDGNVARVLTRLDDDPGDISRPAVRRRLQARAQALLEEAPGEAGDFNQALMELGAIVCTPRAPRCLLCPFHDDCGARRAGTQLERPVKGAAARVERLELAVAVVEREGSLLMRRRTIAEAVMPGFWELPQVEGVRLGPDCFSAAGLERGELLARFRHGITFRSYAGSVYACRPQQPPSELEWIDAPSRSRLPLTTVTTKALRAVDRARRSRAAAQIH